MTLLSCCGWGDGGGVVDSHLQENTEVRSLPGTWALEREVILGNVGSIEAL